MDRPFEFLLVLVVGLVAGAGGVYLLQGRVSTELSPATVSDDSLASLLLELKWRLEESPPDSVYAETEVGCRFQELLHEEATDQPSRSAATKWIDSAHLAVIAWLWTDVLGIAIVVLLVWGTWCRMRSNPRQGWARSGFLSRQGSPSNSASFQPPHEANGDESAS